MHVPYYKNTFNGIYIIFMSFGGMETKDYGGKKYDLYIHKNIGVSKGALKKVHQ